MLSFKDKDQLLTVKQSLDQAYFQSTIMAGKGWQQEARLPWAYLTRASLSLYWLIFISVVFYKTKF